MHRIAKNSVMNKLSFTPQKIMHKTRRLTTSRKYNNQRHIVLRKTNIHETCTGMIRSDFFFHEIIAHRRSMTSEALESMTSEIVETVRHTFNNQGMIRSDFFSHEIIAHRRSMTSEAVESMTSEFAVETVRHTFNNQAHWRFSCMSSQMENGFCNEQAGLRLKSNMIQYFSSVHQG